MKVLISRKTGAIYYYNDKGDFHTKEGYFKEEELKKDQSIIYTANEEKKREFIIFNANNHDLSKKFKRGPQIILPKDLGYIIARTRIGKNSNIIEAGGGTGAATTFFANIAKTLKTYEIRADHCKIIEKNLELMGCDNVELINDDLNNTIEQEKDIDLLFLDMPNCHEILKKDLSGVNNGQYIVCYVPSITQIQEIVNVVKDSTNLYLEEISEIILRHWKVWDRVARPEHRKETDHTAFLVFIRKH